MSESECFGVFFVSLFFSPPIFPSFATEENNKTTKRRIVTSARNLTESPERAVFTREQVRARRAREKTKAYQKRKVFNFKEG